MSIVLLRMTAGSSGDLVQVVADISSIPRSQGAVVGKSEGLSVYTDSSSDGERETGKRARPLILIARMSLNTPNFEGRRNAMNIQGSKAD